MILVGDCRAIMAKHGPFDLIIADPPYGDTSLAWDRIVAGWEAVAASSLKPTGSMWVFGSMRFFGSTWQALCAAGFRYAQDIVWEKNKGSGFAADRFKRVHEHVVQFYRTDASWSGVYNKVQTTPDAVARKVTRKSDRRSHLGAISNNYTYVSEDGGPRIMRSVIPERSCHGRAIHPTEKPIGLLEILVRTSCPPRGLVGDFFAGSGAVADACDILGRRYVGTEIDPDIASAAKARRSASLFVRDDSHTRERGLSGVAS